MEKNKSNKIIILIYTIISALLLILIFTGGIPLGPKEYRSDNFFICISYTDTTLIYNAIVSFIFAVISLIMTFNKKNTFKFKYLFLLIILALIFFVPLVKEEMYGSSQIYYYTLFDILFF